MKLVVVLLSLLSLSSRAEALEPVNAVVGDAGFIAAYGRAPTSEDAEITRIRAHLRYVIARLRATETMVSAAPLVERERLLGVLERYAEAGRFPHNHYVAGRRPVFIDEHGNVCAVGALVEHASGRAAAEAIAAAHRYEYVLEMDAPALDVWADAHGFTVRELAMIQPGYGWEPRPIGPIEPVEPIEPPGPVAPAPSGVPVEALPDLNAFLVLEQLAHTTSADGSTWTKVKASGSLLVVRVDAMRRVTGVATSPKDRLSGRISWVSYRPTGEVWARGTVQNGRFTNTWTFYDRDGTVMYKRRWSAARGWR